METDQDWYWELSVICNSELLDLLTCRLFEQGATGIEELSHSGRQVELKVYFDGMSSQPVTIANSIISEIDTQGDQIKLLASAKKKAENWQSKWKAYFKPIEIGDSFLVLPPWEKGIAQKHHIVIQPGFGFGTGYHESTNLALQLLEWSMAAKPPETALDVGTGSGILAIATLCLGISTMKAIDVDSDAAAEVSSNLMLSGFHPERCRVDVCDPSALQNESYDLVLANIEDHILIEMADDLLRLTQPEGVILLSGILTERKQELLTAFPDTEVIRELTMNEWTGMLLKKTSRSIMK